MIRPVLALLAFAIPVCAKSPSLTFTVSMANPAAHTFHVRLRCEGLRAQLQDFKMPQWSSGYYAILNYARNVSAFRATDARGRALNWEKTARNTWRIVSANTPTVLLDYDVFGNTAFSAMNYLGEDRAFLSPAGLFVYPTGMLSTPVTVELQTPASWPNISTGLDPVKGKPGTFTAADFDTLFDCPILIGTHERHQFEVHGVPHYVAVENIPASVSRPQMLKDLAAMVTAASRLMGDTPYRHYTFLMMGRGGGGIEHTNSSANQFNGSSLTTPAGYQRWLSFIAHEYFHHFNVKRIRPLALGPFDYDQENLTDLLWVSEGLSVYYQDILLVRAGLMTREQYLERMASAIGAFENSSGRNHQSATESSLNTWNAGSGIGGDRNTTISYYNNGAMLGAMLDLQIRAASGNRKSLDDVMRALYRRYYVQQRRGFTAAEFRAECERVGGGVSGALSAVFEYAATTREVEYARYFALAGLQLDHSTEPAAGGYIGLHTSTREIPAAELPPAFPGQSGAPSYRLVVTDAAPGSPAAEAGLQPGDVITHIDGTSASSATPLHKAVHDKGAGQSLTLRIVRSGVEREIAVPVAGAFQRTYRLTRAPSSTAGQAALLESWLGKL